MNDAAARRLGLRTQRNIAAKIIDDAGCVTEVEIKDISSTGARIEAAWGTDIPKQFTLRFGRDNREHRAEIVWRDGFTIGLRFVLPQEELQKPANQPLVTVKPLSVMELRKLASAAKR